MGDDECFAFHFVKIRKYGKKESALVRLFVTLSFLYLANIMCCISCGRQFQTAGEAEAWQKVQSCFFLVGFCN